MVDKKITIEKRMKGMQIFIQVSFDHILKNTQIWVFLTLVIVLINVLLQRVVILGVRSSWQKPFRTWTSKYAAIYSRIYGMRRDVKSVSCRIKLLCIGFPLGWDWISWHDCNSRGFPILHNKGRILMHSLSAPLPDVYN